MRKAVVALERERNVSGEAKCRCENGEWGLYEGVLHN
jgi:hypothetical protein